MEFRKSDWSYAVGKDPKQFYARYNVRAPTMQEREMEKQSLLYEKLRRKMVMGFLQRRIVALAIVFCPNASGSRAEIQLSNNGVLL